VLSDIVIELLSSTPFVCVLCVLKARGICKTMAVRALHTGRLGSALHWGIGSKVCQCIAIVILQFLLSVHLSMLSESIAVSPRVQIVSYVSHSTLVNYGSAMKVMDSYLDNARLMLSSTCANVQVIDHVRHSCSSTSEKFSPYTPLNAGH